MWHTLTFVVTFTGTLTPSNTCGIRALTLVATLTGTLILWFLAAASAGMYRTAVTHFTAVFLKEGQTERQTRWRERRRKTGKENTDNQNDRQTKATDPLDSRPAHQYTAHKGGEPSVGALTWGRPWRGRRWPCWCEGPVPAATPGEWAWYVGTVKEGRFNRKNNVLLSKVFFFFHVKSWCHNHALKKKSDPVQVWCDCRLINEEPWRRS